jgi:hypothetical protein
VGSVFEHWSHCALYHQIQEREQGEWPLLLSARPCGMPPPGSNLAGASLMYGLEHMRLLIHDERQHTPANLLHRGDHRVADRCARAQSASTGILRAGRWRLGGRLLRQGLIKLAHLLVQQSHCLYR